MITFIVLAALMVGVALWFVLPPLLRRDDPEAPARASLNQTLFDDKLRELEDDLRQGTLAPEQFEQAKLDLIRNLRRDTPAGEVEPAQAPEPAAARARVRTRRWLAPAVGLAMALAAVALYLVLSPRSAVVNDAPPPTAQGPLLPPHPGLTADAMAKGANGKAEPIDAAIEKLARRLKDNPNDANGWLLLGRSYQFLKRYAEADQALIRAISLGKTDAATKALEAKIHALAGNSPAATASAPAAMPATGAEMPTAVKPAASVDELTAHLKQQPDDGRAWIALGRAYHHQHRYLDAVGAYAKATALIKDNALLWAEYADALTAANGGHFNDHSTAMVEKALSINPNETMALWLSGTAALKRGDKDAALKQWLHLKKILPPDSEDAKIIDSNIAEIKGEPAPQAKVAQQQAAPGGASVHGVVTISPALAKEMNPGDTLFIFAKASNGPPMPLAVLRKKAGDLPCKFELDDSMSMMPAAKLSNFSEIIVGARISKSGSPLPSSGDLEGTSGVVKVGDNRIIRIVIDHRV